MRRLKNLQDYKNKKVLITGGGGLIGRQLVELLVKLEAGVISIGLDNPEVYSKFIKCDLTHKDYCMEVIKGYDYVFHLAGVKASPDITNRCPATMSIPALQINTNALEACRLNGIQNVLFTSSIGAYSQADILTEENAYKGEPMDFYPGMVKRMAEYQIQAYQKEYGLGYKIVRLTNCYGPGDNFDPNNGMFIPSLMAKVFRGDDPVEIWGDGSANRDFLHSRDAAQGILRMMLYAPPCQPVNIGSGEGCTVAEVVSLFQRIAGFNYRFDASKPSGIAKRVMNITRARQYGFAPETSLKQGLKETWNWFREHPLEYEKRLNYFAEKKEEASIADGWG